jgi:hypothetical protein
MSKPILIPRLLTLLASQPNTATVFNPYTSTAALRNLEEYVRSCSHIIVMLCGYTSDARWLADAHCIEIVNEAGLGSCWPGTAPKLLAALHDDRKVCPKWESEMRLRTARKGGSAGSQFWGCSTYPRCRYTVPFDPRGNARQLIWWSSKTACKASCRM